MTPREFSSRDKDGEHVIASDANPNPIGITIIAGLGGANPGRPDDRWGVAYCDYLFSHSLNAGLASLGGGLRDERVLEAYYDASLERIHRRNRHPQRPVCFCVELWV